jgi:hypothetical protein
MESPDRFYRKKVAQPEEDRLNSEVYPKLLARYNELQYCTNCHTIFDAWGNAADANENGFDAMMHIDPARVGAA